MLKRMVVWDPTGTLQQCTAVDDDQAVQALVNAGALALPVDLDLMARGPIAGFAARWWGPGWRFLGTAPTRACPMQMFVTTEVQVVHWAARLEPLGDAPPSGIMRLVTHATQTPAALSGGLSAVAQPVDLGGIGAPDEHGGWTVKGMSRLASVSDGYLAVALHGSCDGVRVMVSAISGTR